MYDSKDCPGQVTYSVGQVKISVACPTGQVVISFLSLFLLMVYFNSSTRFRVTLAVFVLRIHSLNISFLLHHQTD